MAGRGFPPKTQRRNPSDVPSRGEWQTTEAVGWQHGEIPRPPARLRKASRDAWFVWMGSFFASHWVPEDLPGLRQLIRLYDQVERGEFQRHAELRMAMDTYGITPKGQQDRRWVRPGWVRPKLDGTPEAPPPAPEADDPYRHLRVVGND